jgi:transposase-like protein
MGQRKLTQGEREQIYLLKRSGQTLGEIAIELGISYECARKWWRRAQKEGVMGLQERKRGRPSQGVLSQFAPEVQQACLNLKRQHKRWGANRVLIELRNDPTLAGMRLPSRSRLYPYFQQHCPDCLSIWTKHKNLPTPPRATAVHEVWQVDAQEGHRLTDGSIATVCNVRDPYGAAMLASQAFAVQTVQRWRKLTWEEVRQVLRSGFSEWRTLADSVQTDNEMGLGGNPNDPFPSWLSLWLAGLGIKHTFIRSHCPTDQPQIERHHRTLDGLSDDEQSRQDLMSFQRTLDQERFVYNYQFPVRASDCQGSPPIQAHPALLTPRRPYQPEWEAALFDMQRVYDFLASFTFERKVNSNGQATLKGIHYTVGHIHAGKTIKVRLDALTCEWVFLELDAQGQEQELRRQPLKGLDFMTLTGWLSLQDPLTLPPIQLTLPLAA